MNSSKDNSTQPTTDSEAVVFRTAMRRMVDGELPHAERAALLLRLPPNSPRWRELALAFVEQQVLKESLAPILNAAKPAIASRISQTSSSSVAITPAFKQPRRISVGWLAAVIACLFFGFMLGQFWPAWNSHLVTNPMSTDGKTAERSDASRLDGDERPEQVAQVLSETLNRSGGPIPLAIRREMMRCGYVIIEQDRYSTIQLPGGRTLELPIRSVAVTYLGNSAYQ